MLCLLSGTGFLFLLLSSTESQIHLILSEAGPESQRPAAQLHSMFKRAPAARPPPPGHVVDVCTVVNIPGQH